MKNNLYNNDFLNYIENLDIDNLQENDYTALEACVLSVKNKTNLKAKNIRKTFFKIAIAAILATILTVMCIGKAINDWREGYKFPVPLSEKTINDNIKTIGISNDETIISNTAATIKLLSHATDGNSYYMCFEVICDKISDWKHPMIKLDTEFSETNGKHYNISNSSTLTATSSANVYIADTIIHSVDEPDIKSLTVKNIKIYDAYYAFDQNGNCVEPENTEYCICLNNNYIIDNFNYVDILNFENQNWGQISISPLSITSYIKDNIDAEQIYKDCKTKVKITFTDNSIINSDEKNKANILRIGISYHTYEQYEFDGITGGKLNIVFRNPVDLNTISKIEVFRKSMNDYDVLWEKNG